MVLTRVMYLY